jgi:hypothetical protein
MRELGQQYKADIQDRSARTRLIATYLMLRADGSNAYGEADPDGG